MNKRQIHIVTWIAVVILLVVLIVSVKSYDADMECKAVELNIDTNQQYCFLTEEELIKEIDATGEVLQGQRIKDLELDLIESMLEDNIYVRNADVFITVDGIVKINVQQRRPLVRISNAYDERYFLDDFGRIMPLNPEHAARTIIANGYIPETINDIRDIDADMDNYSDSLKQYNLHYKIFKLVQFIEKDKFWNAQITQIYINKNKEFELIPLVGSHIIVLDDPLDNLELKFENLKLFYDQGLNKVGWNRYKSINISIENQVVCTLRDSLL